MKSVWVYERFLTVEEVAEYLHLNEQTVRRYCREGVFEACKSGNGSDRNAWLIEEKSFFEFLNKRRAEARAKATVSQNDGVSEPFGPTTPEAT